MHQKHPPPKTAVCSLAMTIRSPRVREFPSSPHRSYRTASSGACTASSGAPGVPARPSRCRTLDALLSPPSLNQLLLNFERHHVPVSILTFAIVECHAFVLPVAGELVSSDQNQMFAVANVQLKRSASSHHAQQCLRCGGAIYRSQLALDE